MQREELDQPWKNENVRRSLAMLSPGEPGLSREDAILVLELLDERMDELLAERMDGQPSGPVTEQGRRS